MKTNLSIKNLVLTYLMLIFWVCNISIASAQPRPWMPPAELEFTAKATGRTTGHIADLDIKNPRPKPRQVEIPALVIPSDGIHQGYIVPDPTPVTVPGNSTATVPLRGYCTDPNLPAPPPGIIIPTPVFLSDDDPRLQTYRQNLRLFWELQQTGQITTPFSSNPEREREAIIQQFTWYYSHPTVFDPCLHIRRTITDHFRDTDWYSSGIADIEQGIAQITDAIIRIGREAGLDDFTTPILPPEITQPKPALPPSHPDIANTVRVTGTGRTTGHIADITISNPTNKPVTVVIGDPGSSFLIPSNGRDQSYIVPSIPEIYVGPRQTVTSPIEGYCVDVRRPPVGDGRSAPPISEWIQASDPAPPDPLNPGGPHSTASVVTLPTQKAPPLSTIADVLTNTPAAPILSNWDCPDLPVPTTPLIPGTETPIRIPINTDVATGVAAPILTEALKNITQAYEELQPKGGINTPFSNNRDREREAVIQQTFWQYSSALQGEPYAKEDFHQNTVQQFEKNTNQKYDKLPEEQKEKIDAGVDDFWDSFSAVGVEAKILPPSVPVPSIGVPALQDVFNTQNLKSYSAETPSPFTSPEDLMFNVKEDKRKKEKEDKQCECGMVTVKVSAWDYDENTRKSKEGTGKSDTRNASTSDGVLEDYNINIGKEKIPDNSSQIIAIYVEKIDCPCVNLAADKVKDALEKLKEAEKMKVGTSNKETNLAKLEDELKKLNDKKRKSNSDEKKIDELEKKIKAIKEAQEEIAKAKGTAKTSDCPVFFDQNDVEKKPEERKKNPNVEVYTLDSKGKKVNSGGEWRPDSGKKEAYTFVMKKVKDKPMEFRFDLTFHCQDDDCKPVTCNRTFVVKVEKVEEKK